MSKVIHLSNEAHQKAKEYCTRHGLKMSDWVADLIIATVVAGDAPKPARQSAPPVSTAKEPSTAEARVVTRPVTTQRRPVVTEVTGKVAVVERKPVAGDPNAPKKKPLVRIDSRPQASDSGVAPWEAPPFWTGSRE